MTASSRILPVQSVRSESRQISNRSLRQHAANATEEPILPNFGGAAKVCFGALGSLFVFGSRTRNSGENSSIEVMI
jgi:hypothetical protein